MHAMAVFRAGPIRSHRRAVDMIVPDPLPTVQEIVAMERLMSMVLVLQFSGGLAAQENGAQPTDAVRAVRTARDKGLDWLTKNQAADGSWGKQYTIAVTSFACLAYLAASDEPYDGDHVKALVKGLEFLLANQKEGVF